MTTIADLTFVAADGDTPPDVGLEILPDSRSVFAVVSDTFQAFLAPGAAVRFIDSWPIAPTDPVPGLKVIYVYGHAWVTAETTPAVSMKTKDGQSCLLVGAVFLDGLTKSLWLDSDTVVFLDTCHAASFTGPLSEKPVLPRLTVFASGEEESAIALIHERATRFALSLHREVHLAAKARVDLTCVVSNVSQVLDRDSVITGQTVSYLMNGAQVVLSPGPVSSKLTREVTSARIRQRLLAGGAIAALLFVSTGEYYRRSALIEVDLVSLEEFTSLAYISLYEQFPDDNDSKLVRTIAVQPGIARVRVPATNLVVEVAGTDPERFRFHLWLAPGLAASEKWIHLTLPPATEIRRHSGMAYIPPTPWISGQDLHRSRSDHGFWIDREPSTVERYLPLVEGWAQRGDINVDESVLLTTRERQAALTTVGLDQLNSLNNQLGDIFGVIAKADELHAAAPGHIAEGLGELPCAKCPAPMTRIEAQKFCEDRGLRLPTNLEWELAARGVDGRLFPWGNRADQSMANVGLPREVGVPKKLEPVHRYPKAASPFGLIDMVGNAGDWVINETGAYDRTYMGATYRYDPQDATTYRLLPVTDAYNHQEITVRCVSGPALQGEDGPDSISGTLE